MRFRQNCRCAAAGRALPWRHDNKKRHGRQSLMYPSVTQFETRQREVDEWLASRQAARDAKKGARSAGAPPWPPPRWLARLVAVVRPRAGVTRPSTPAGRLALLPRPERDALGRLASDLKARDGMRLVAQGKP